MALEGTKHDAGKPRYDLIPPEEMEDLANLFTIGAKKYGDRNWEKGMKWGRVFRALLSHSWKWWRGEECDQEDGQHHLDSVMWCAMVLRHYKRYSIGEDDRPNKGVNNETSPLCSTVSTSLSFQYQPGTGSMSKSDW